MDDLISRQEVIDVLNKHSVMFEFHLPHEFYEVKEEIRGLPSAQPEIVRCKDCLHGLKGIPYRCRLAHDTDSENWYCADAKKREI